MEYGWSWEMVTFGPMFHWNFGDWKHGEGFQKNDITISLEGAYWVEPNTSLGRGIDFGVEFELAPKSGHGKCHLYSEAEVGLLLGASFGPVLELSEGKPPKLGFQGSQWGALGLGIDIRECYMMEGTFSMAPGLFFKI